MRYKVEHFEDSTYKVYVLRGHPEDDDCYWEDVLQDNLAACEAYIRLHEQGYM